MNDQHDEVAGLLADLGFISETSKLGQGDDEVSNLALRTIQKRAERMFLVLRSISETKMFATHEFTRSEEKPQMLQRDRPLVAT